MSSTPDPKMQYPVAWVQLGLITPDGEPTDRAVELGCATGKRHIEWYSKQVKAGHLYPDGSPGPNSRHERQRRERIEAFEAMARELAKKQNLPEDGPSREAKAVRLPTPEETRQRRADAMISFPSLAVSKLSIHTNIFDRDAEDLYQSAKNGALSALIGTTGTGKTTLATAIARRYMLEHNEMAIYTTAGVLFDTIAHECTGYGAAFSIDQWIRDHTQKCGLLVIDELDKFAALKGTNDTSRERKSWFCELIDRRYSSVSRPTLLIGNFTIEEWQAVVPRSIRDRIREGGCAINRTGKSYRGD